MYSTDQLLGQWQAYSGWTISLVLVFMNVHCLKLQLEPNLLPRDIQFKIAITHGLFRDKCSSV
jgi:hypothetical protein